MTLSEFKAWFEGFSEGIDKAPTEKQFAKIKAKVAEINGAPLTQTIFVDRYVRPYPSYWERPYATWSTSGGTTVQATASLKNLYASTGGSQRTAPSEFTDGYFDSHAAMRDLGRVEALN